MAEARAVLFDIDGTLIDSNALHVAAWRQAFSEAGHAVPDQAIAKAIGMGTDKLVPAVWPEADDDTITRLGDRHGTIFKDRYLAQAKPFPHARDLVARAHGAGLTAVLATSGSDEEVAHYVDLLGIGHFLTGQTSSDEVDETKPAADIFVSALAKAGVPAAAAIAIGDTPYDIEAAARSGIATIALLCGGFDRAELAGAVAIYRDAADLLARFDASPLARQAAPDSAAT